MKATAGVGGRCSPKEAAADTAKRTTGIDQDRKEKDRKEPGARDEASKRVCREGHPASPIPHRSHA
jgi:hypothetical protein